MNNLRARIHAGETVIGTFIKTPAPQLVEILALAGLDFVTPDQEHAPLDLGQIDAMVMAARSAGLALVPRCWGHDPARIAPLLDLGCSGVMVPHVMDAKSAEGVLDAMKFARGKRGVSPSPRSGGYGSMGLSDFVKTSDEHSVLFAQIEDASALAHLDEIASIDGVDVLFVGPADLSQSLGCGFPWAQLDRAIEQVISAAKSAGKAAGLFVGDAAQVLPWQAKGISVFIVGSDQSLVMKGARSIMAQSRG